MAYNGQPSDQQFNVAVYGDNPSGNVVYRFTNINGSKAFNSALVTSVQITSNVLTVTAVNTFTAGQIVQFYSMTTPNDFLNGAAVLIATASGTQFTANYVHANFGPSAEANGYVLVAEKYATLGVLSQEDPSTNATIGVTGIVSVMDIDTASDYILPTGFAGIVFPGGITGIDGTASHEGTGRLYGTIAVNTVAISTNVLTVTFPSFAGPEGGILPGSTVTFGSMTSATFLNSFGPITQTQQSGGTLTVTVANSLVSGQLVQLRGTTAAHAALLNGVTFTVATASGTQFTVTGVSGNPYNIPTYGPSVDTGTVHPAVVVATSGSTQITASFTHANYGPTADTSGIVEGGSNLAIIGSTSSANVQQNTAGIDWIVGQVIDTGNQGHVNTIVGSYYCPMGDDQGWADNVMSIFISPNIGYAGIRPRETTVWGIYEANATEKNQLGEIQMGSKLTKYNSIATVSNGVPAEYATVDLLTQSASIGTATLYAVPASGAGMYRISYYLKVTQAATTSSSVQITFTYTDRDDSTVLSFLSASPLNATDETGVVSGQMIVDAKLSTNIQYATTYASVGGTSMQYKLRLKVEAL